MTPVSILYYRRRPGEANLRVVNVTRAIRTLNIPASSLSSRDRVVSVASRFRSESLRIDERRAERCGEVPSGHLFVTPNIDQAASIRKFGVPKAGASAFRPARGRVRGDGGIRALGSVGRAGP